MKSFTFIHAADLHLGCPFVGLRAANPAVADAADAATYRAYEKIVELAIERNAAFIVFAGDIFDCEDRNLCAQLRFRDGLARLEKHDIPAFIAHGNHDHIGGSQAAIRWPENAHFFPGEPSPPQIVQRDGKPLVNIYGYSYPRRDVTESILHHYEREPEYSGVFSIGILHANVGGQTEHASYAPCSLDDLRRVGIDYWALGHVHGHAVLHPAQPTVVYPGCPQGLSPRERGQRGACVVEVAADGTPQVEFVTTDSLRWEEVTIDIEELPTFDVLEERLQERLEELRPPEASLIARVTLTGRGSLHRELQQPDRQEILINRWNVDVEREPFVWIDRLRVQTRTPVDVEERRKSDDIIGDYLRLAQQVASDNEQENALLEMLTEEMKRPAASAQLQMMEIDGLLSRAEAVGLDLLLGDETA